jgi:hypothetical protein
VDSKYNFYTQVDNNGHFNLNVFILLNFLIDTKVLIAHNIAQCLYKGTRPEEGGKSVSEEGLGLKSDKIMTIIKRMYFEFVWKSKYGKGDRQAHWSEKHLLFITDTV